MVVEIDFGRVSSGRSHGRIWREVARGLMTHGREGVVGRVVRGERVALGIAEGIGS
jgi:hypothetical protein